MAVSGQRQAFPSVPRAVLRATGGRARAAPSRGRTAVLVEEPEHWAIEGAATSCPGSWRRGDVENTDSVESLLSHGRASASAECDCQTICYRQIIILNLFHSYESKLVQISATNLTERSSEQLVAVDECKQVGELF